MVRENKPYIGRVTHLAIRLLIASYFIAVASGLFPSENGKNLMSFFVPDGYEAMAVTAFVFTCAYLILLGRQIRAAALLLSLYIFWGSFMANFGPGTTLNLQEFWSDIALIGALLLTYSERDPRVQRNHKFRIGKHIQPRRVILSAPVNTDRPVVRKARQPDPDGPDSDESHENIFSNAFDAA